MPDRHSTRQVGVDVHASFTASPLAGPVEFWRHRLGIDGRFAIAPYAQVNQALLTAAAGTGDRTCLTILLRWEDWLRHSGAQCDRRTSVLILHRRLAEYISLLAGAVSSGTCSVTTYLCPASGEFKADLGADTLGSLALRLRRASAALPATAVVDLDGLGEAFGQPDIDDPHADLLGHIPYRHDFFSVLAGVLVGGLATARRHRPYLLLDLSVASAPMTAGQLLTAVRPGTRVGIICADTGKVERSSEGALALLDRRRALDVHRVTGTTSADRVARLVSTGAVEPARTLFLALDRATRDQVEKRCRGILGVVVSADLVLPDGVTDYPWPLGLGGPTPDRFASGASDDIEPARLHDVHDNLRSADQIQREYRGWRRTVRTQL